jgi:hypothetical protein
VQPEHIATQLLQLERALGALGAQDAGEAPAPSADET